MNSSINKRLAKLSAETTALNNCRDDMSDVNFEIGRYSYSLRICIMIIAFAVFFGGRILARRYAGNPDYSMSVIDKAFWIFIGCLLIYTIVSTIIQSKKTSITIAGKTIFYNGNCWTSDEISYVKCSKLLERITVCSNGQKILSFPWELDNSELFIAWVKKCGITFDDKRVGM